MLSLLSPANAVRTPLSRDFSGQGKQEVRSAGWQQDQTKSSVRQSIRRAQQKRNAAKWSTQIENAESSESESESGEQQDSDQFSSSSSSSSSHSSDSDQSSSSSSFTSHVLGWSRRRVRRPVKQSLAQKQPNQHNALKGQDVKTITDNTRGSGDCDSNDSDDSSSESSRSTNSEDDSEEQECDDDESSVQGHTILTQSAISQYFSAQTEDTTVASQGMSSTAVSPQLSQQLSPIPFPQTQVQEQDEQYGSQ